MRQLLLDLPADKPQTLASFVTGANAEVKQLLQRIEQNQADSLDERTVYLWGEAGSGKSHLLQALAALPQARLIDSASATSAFDYDPAVRCYLLDDVERLSDDNQIAAFALFNQVRERGGNLVASGNAAPAKLAVREDLRTRFGWGLIYQVHGLSDDEKIAALTQAAQTRGLPLNDGVLPYLLTHFARDMRSLSAMLDALDAYSLETKRPITLPLLRELLQRND
ncbi:MAG: DnaA regulatory inactivator Hda [Oxalicibacterium faecigallinarum]|uniref:DnaA regulatory inactivator Hda n=1 Tax=Oxalicibacterium faecigallinarum TaxID=573741 RepID=A0A8J3F441_9BURK|nr:DnaA regulatory inactivator Hda [Oxalicibacterium faecigallinarum]MDQ7969571.1 DnaA regulatory inactivator Hda [Oxalicibacterium faecigallinarum]GGI20404.1 DnaA regulatory inactivator Hda [Oxalicibacterium faecigallinarum]